MKAVESFRCDSGMTGCGNFVISSTFSQNNQYGVKILEPVKVEIDPINEKAKYSIYDVANWFLIKGNMTQKKLQKLCYYEQAWCYEINYY